MSNTPILNTDALRRAIANRDITCKSNVNIFTVLLVLISIPAFVALTILTQFVRNYFKGIPFGTGITDSSGKPLFNADGKTPLTFVDTTIPNTDDTFRCVGDVKTITGLSWYFFAFQMFVLLYVIGMTWAHYGKDNKAELAINIVALILALFNIIVVSILLGKLTKEIRVVKDASGNAYNCIKFTSAQNATAFTGVLYASIAITIVQLIYIIFHVNGKATISVAPPKIDSIVIK